MTSLASTACHRPSQHLSANLALMWARRCRMIASDNPWKEACEKKLNLVFDLLYPLVYRALDWSQDYVPLDGELRRFSPSSKAGGRIADRLIKAFARESGDPRYFHLEVQGKRERNFSRRIHVCNYRAEESYNS